MDTSSIPQKRCTKCHNSYPATIEYFYKKERGLYGLFSWCKACHCKLATRNYVAWQRSNPGKVLARDRRFRKNNPDSNRRKLQRRSAKQRELPATFTAQDWKCALAYFNGACAYCSNPPSLFDKVKVLQQDHYIPVAKGGAYTPDNIVPACQSCNQSKSDNDPVIWCKHRFGKRAKIILKRINDYLHSRVQ